MMKRLESLDVLRGSGRIRFGIWKGRGHRHTNEEMFRFFKGLQ